MNNTNMIWKNCMENDNFKVSEKGDVMDKRRNRLKVISEDKGTGFKVVHINKRRYLHNVVWEAFNGLKGEGNVLYLKGDKSDCSLKNIRCENRGEYFKRMRQGKGYVKCVDRRWSKKKMEITTYIKYRVYIRDPDREGKKKQIGCSLTPEGAREIFVKYAYENLPHLYENLKEEYESISQDHEKENLESADENHQSDTLPQEHQPTAESLLPVF